MPSAKIHCKNSKERIGKTFEELHNWMDEAQPYLGQDHRIERHSCSYIPYVKKKWGIEGVKEFLHHIIEDYQDTLNKFDSKCVVCGNESYGGKKLCLSCWKKFNGKE